MSTGGGDHIKGSHLLMARILSPMYTTGYLKWTCGEEFQTDPFQPHEKNISVPMSPLDIPTNSHTECRRPDQH